QRHGRVARLFQHAAVELQPGELAVDEESGIRGVVDDRWLDDRRLSRPTRHAVSLPHERAAEPASVRLRKESGAALGSVEAELYGAAIAPVPVSPEACPLEHLLY